MKDDRMSKARWVQEYIMVLRGLEGYEIGVSSISDYIKKAENMWEALTEAGYGEREMVKHTIVDHELPSKRTEMHETPHGNILVQPSAFVDDGLHQGKSADYWKADLDFCSAKIEQYVVENDMKMTEKFTNRLLKSLAALASAKRRDEHLENTGGV